MKVSNLLTYQHKINFNGASLKSLEYLNYRKSELLKHDITESHQTLNMFEMDKLEGLQNDLKILGKLTMKQIKFFVEQVGSIITQRGCNNMCAHCYADARPESYYRDNNTISKINFEDFETLCNDISILNNRMGFKIFNKNEPVFNPYDYITLFYDADCSKIVSEDKNGNVYDYVDLAEIMYNAVNKPILFDTAGWNLQDKKTQKRMEKLIDKVVKSKDKYDFITFNVSANPFHTMYYNSVLKKQEGKIDISNKMLNHYTTRMANVLYTITPLIQNNKHINFISRAFSNYSKNNGFQERDFLVLYDKILDKLEKIYREDYNSKQKIIKNEEDIPNILEYIRTRIKKVDTYIIPSERTKENFNINSYEPLLKQQHSISQEEIINEMILGFVDLDGKFYLSNYKEVFPTNIKLDYSTKNKNTAPIKPTLNEKEIKI